ncbi:hypothetical protein DRP05_02635 [Archaeoglobales archaeon]|nr:MAG: hypothetical protein DRP05_02635 [Archaeoglobales archaeon]
MDLLRTEYDIRHILAVSRRNIDEHALIRIIVSSLARKEEILNVTKRDFKRVKRNGFEFYTVKLTGTKTRIMPIDGKTYNIVSEICKNKRNKERVFNYTSREMDEIVDKNSPPDKTYNVEKLRSGVIEILKDCMFFGSIEFGEDLDKTANFLQDFHPMYSGMWDLDDDEVLEDFVLNFSKVTGIRDAKTIAELLNEDVKRIDYVLARR